MIIRKIREEEYRRTQEVFGIAFEIQIAKEQLSDEKWKQIREGQFRQQVNETQPKTWSHI